MASDDSLIVPVNADGIVCYKFTVKDGAFTVAVEWESYDEIYGNGEQIRIPPDVWVKAWPWLVQKMKSQTVG